MKVLKSHRAFIVIASIGTAYRLFFAVSGMCEGTILADDSYYYFTIARNIANGLGPTFDGVSITNGFHPLWLVVLIPIFKLLGGYLWFPIRIALAVSVIIDFFSGLVIYRALSNRGFRSAALAASAIWYLSPLTLYTGLRGMESSLSVLLSLLVFGALINVMNRPEKLSYRAAIGFGVLLGLAGLSRIDNAIILGLSTAIIVLILIPKYRLARGVRWVLTIGIIAFMLTLPWFVWNLLNFGSLIQVSGLVKANYRPALGLAISDGLIGFGKWLFYNILAPLTYPVKFLSGEEFQSPQISLWFTLGILGLVMFLLLVRFKENLQHIKRKKVALVVLPAFLILMLHLLLYGVILRFYAGWYSLPFLAFSAIIIGMLLFIGHPGRRRLSQSFIIGAIIAINLGLHVIFLTRGDHQPRGPEAYYGPTLSAIAEDRSGETIVGAFNAGAIGYIAPKYGDMKVVNLDCLVNNRAYEALKKGQYFDYVTGTIDVLFENPRGAAPYLNQSELDSLCAIYNRVPGRDYWAK